MQGDNMSTDTTVKDGWYDREYWRAGVLVGWIGKCFNPETMEQTGWYAQGSGAPLSFLVKNAPRADAVSAVEEIERAG